MLFYWQGDRGRGGGVGVCVCVCGSLNQVFCGPRTEDSAFSEIYMIWEFDSLDNFFKQAFIDLLSIH